MAQNASDAQETRWPVFRSLASFRAGDLPGDLIAGLTLAAIAIPEQMATARLGNFPPQIGFFAFIAGSIGFAMFGANRFLSCGADSTITPIFAGGLLLMAASHSPEYQALAVALALLVGAILVLASLFRMGWIANLLSTPVTVGFLAGISIHIIVSQLPGVLGLPPIAGKYSPNRGQKASDATGAPRHLGRAVMALRMAASGAASSNSSASPR